MPSAEPAAQHVATPSPGTTARAATAEPGACPIPRDRLAVTPVELVAPRLLGARLISHVGGERVAVRLSEVEAYAGQADPGSHAYRGRTPRTAVMFGPAGFSYVYLSYGLHWCLNVVTGPDGTASAVLLRAGEVVEGLAAAQARRPRAKAAELCRGPARLTKALGLTREHGGLDLLDPASPLRLELSSGAAGEYCTGPRVGVAGAGAATPWRFWLRDDPTVSAYRPAARRTRGSRA